MSDTKTSSDTGAGSDERFQFLRQAVVSLCGLEQRGEASSGVLSGLEGEEAVRAFLDDASCRVLRVSVVGDVRGPDGFRLSASNKLDESEPPSQKSSQHGPGVSFIKVGVRPLEPQNMSSEVMVTSHGGGHTTLRSLYNAVHNLYAPSLLESEHWTSHLDVKLQDLLAKLDVGLGAAVNAGTAEDAAGRSDSGRRRETQGDDNGEGLYGPYSSILSMSSEFDFWTDSASSGSGRVRSAASRFRDILEPLSTRWASLEDSSMKLSAAVELIEDTQNALDDIWKLDGLSSDQQYPQKRMEHLFGIIAASLGRHVQNSLGKLDLWKGSFVKVRAGLRDAVRVCAKWGQATRELTGTFWPTYDEHPWIFRTRDSTPHVDEHLAGLGARLSEVGRLRTTYEELCNLLSASEQTQLRVSETFGPFENQNALRYSRYTQPRWVAAVRSYEELLAPIERHIASNLQRQMSRFADRPQQLLREFQRYKNLIGRPNIGKVLMSERQTLLAQLISHVEHLDGDFETRTSGRKTQPPAGRNTSHNINCVVWGKQLRNKVRLLLRTATPLLKDLGSAFMDFKDAADALEDKVAKWTKDRVVAWDERMQEKLQDRRLSVQISGRLMEIDSRSGNMVVNYSEALVQLLRDVRQLRGLAFNVSRNIANAAIEGEKYYRYGVALKKVANFYNTMDRQIIKCTKPMLLQSLLEFDKRVKSRGERGAEITWSNPNECQDYVDRLQKAAEHLSLENRRLRRLHQGMTDQVVALMSVDLLRQKARWKARWSTLKGKKKELIATYDEKQTKGFLLHWDHQVYKALEASYRMGLESLNENLGEIKCELVFTSRTVLFRPPLEELRSQYYREMRKFIGIPNSFSGFGNRQVYTPMADRNASSLIQVYVKAEGLFTRLREKQDSLKDWVVLGQVSDIFSYVEERVTEIEQWETNFDMLKKRRKALDKMPDFYKIDCFSVSATPLKAAIEDQLTSFGDALIISLRKSVMKSLVKIETFLQNSMEILGVLPNTIAEIGNAKAEWKRIVDEKSGMRDLTRMCNKQKKLLLQVAGMTGSIDVAEVTQRLAQLPGEWENFDVAVEAFSDILEDAKAKMKDQLEQQMVDLNVELDKFGKRWHALKPVGEEKAGDWGDAAIERVFSSLEDWKKDFAEIKVRTDAHCEACDQFQMNPPKFEGLSQLEEDMESVATSWNLYKEYADELNEMGKQDWITFRGKLFDVQDFCKKWGEKIKSRSAVGVRDMVDERISERLDKLKRSLPALKYCRGEPFKDEHWSQLFFKLKMPKGLSLASLRFEHFLGSLDLVVKNARFAKEMTARAQGEVQIREALMEIKTWAEAAEVKMMEHEELGRRTPLIHEWKELFSELGDNQMLLQSLKDSPYYKAFQDTGSQFEQKFALLDEVLHCLNQIQRKWVYLEPIFGRGALPSEQSRFNRVDEEFREILQRLESEPTVFNLADDTIFPRLGESVNTMLAQLERCSKALNDFLEQKRSKMPRFYFIGDEDLLEILGQAQNPAVIQTHLKKLFQGVHQVRFAEGNRQILALRSVKGEEVLLRNPTNVTDQTEQWLDSLSREMKQTLKAVLVDCVREDKLDNIMSILPAYPAQVLCVAAQCGFTRAVEQGLRGGNLGKLQELLSGRLAKYTSLDLSTEPLLQLKIKSMILELIHMNDVVQLLRDEGVVHANEWKWQKQLRYTIDNATSACVVRMVNAEFSYTYEYQGNRGLLVHTPLTDKCYLTLTQGMHMGFGGNPYGPAGTGKTESVKALGGCLGRQVLVFNCDEAFDLKSMGRIFTGLVKCGAWGCFDEFNRLKEDQLSAVSQQIQVIQAAIKLKASTLVLLGRTIDVDHNAGIFVTMNPAGKHYGGRSKLPENLKNLFRPVAMSRPDNDIISEAILFSEGFQGAKSLSHKLCELYSLSKRLLSAQQHYDWGLRAMKAVLNTGGKLVQQAKVQSGGNGVSLKTETEILIKSVRVNTLSKLTFSDARTFLGLIADVFPGVASEDIRYEQLEAAMKEVMTGKSYNLAFDEGQIQKMLQLKESLDQRMGCVIVGPSGCGKSTLWRVLRDAMQMTGQVVKTYVMNPKSMPRVRLLGRMDLDTREWFDGVLTDAARKVVKEPMNVRSWIVCDGDVDPVWIESLNSVLDDNHLLTMPNGERISFGSNVNFIFETHDLRFASPATISRMGMIYLSDEDVDVRRLLKTWLAQRPETTQLDLQTWIKDYFYRGLDWVLRDGMSQCIVETTLVGTVTTGLSHLVNCSTLPEFLVGMLRGLGGNLDTETRVRFAKELFSWAGESPPDIGSPLDCFARGSLLQSYESETTLRGKLGSGGILLTASMQRNSDIVSGWLEKMEPFILVGPEGAGKSLLLQHLFSTKLKTSAVSTLHCNSQTTAEHVIQRIAQACVEQTTNTGRVLRPRSGDRLVLYLKDINLPKPDEYNTCMLIAFLQQLITFNGFYSESLEFVRLERVQIVASMNAATTVGRHPLSTRFTAIVNIAFMEYPSRDELVSVYAGCFEATLGAIRTPVLDSKMQSPKELRRLASTLVDLYDQIKSRFSVDDYRHYLFTPRDLTKLVTGLLRYDLATESILDVFAYEARRVFRDRLVDVESMGRFDSILNSVLRTQWHHTLDITDSYFTGLASASSIGGARGGEGKNSEGKDADHESANGSTQEATPDLLRTPVDAFLKIVENGLELYEREERHLEMLFFSEILEHIAQVDHALSKDQGNVLLVGRSGVGRRTATSLVAHMRGMRYFTLNIQDKYTKKHFHAELKTILATAGVENEATVLYIEDHQMVLSEVLESLNSLLSSGEVPGLYKHEELGPLLEPLREEMQDVGGFRTPYEFFTHRIRCNLHIAIAMDPTAPSFAIKCESNPALYTRCAILWMGQWSRQSLQALPAMLLPRMFSSVEDGGLDDSDQRLLTAAVEIHSTQTRMSSNQGGKGSDRGEDSGSGAPSISKKTASPRDYVAFLKCFHQLYDSKLGGVEESIQRLTSGLDKLNEASKTVDKLSGEAKEKERELRVKQETADRAMDEITDALEQASERRKEVQILREEMQEEQKKTEEQKGKIQVELRDVQPVLEQAQKAVGGIKSDNLNEIRSLKMPPEAIHDVLSAVLLLLGIRDTSWLSMKNFLGKRGVKDEILNYDAHNMTPKIRKQVAKTLRAKASSFDDANIYRVSVAAAPLALWVKANVRYSLVLDKIEPLERDLEEANRTLQRSQDRLQECQGELDEIDNKVKEMKNVFKAKTREAETLRQGLERTQETLTKAETLLGKLSGEQERWERQVEDLNETKSKLSMQMLVAAGFNTYLAKSPEDTRQGFIQEWTKICGLNDERNQDRSRNAGFNYRRIMSTESEQLKWKAEGLPSDSLSMENAMVILAPGPRTRAPFIIDPATTATNWLKNHLASAKEEQIGKDGKKRAPLEVVNRADSKFAFQVELAVKFGKTLIVTEADGVDPMLYPLIRMDLYHQGPRLSVMVGDKAVDYHENFRMYICTRNPEPDIPPDAAPLIDEINFTVTRSGLEGQLLGVTIENEQPDLEEKKSKLLAEEEQFKVQLADLEKDLLKELADSEGNLLENIKLIESLTRTKTVAADVNKRIEESSRASLIVDDQRELFRPFARCGSTIFFAIQALQASNHMYQFSLATFLLLFKQTLADPSLSGADSGSSESAAELDKRAVEERLGSLTPALEKRVLFYIGRSLFKADRLMWGLHLVRAMYPHMFQENEWEVFTGTIVGDLNFGSNDDSKSGDSKSSSGSRSRNFPSWASGDRAQAFNLLESTFPRLVGGLQLDDVSLWGRWARSSECEKVFPGKISTGRSKGKVTPFQKVLIVQALRPDRLQSAMGQFVEEVLDVPTIAPPADSMSLKNLYEKETGAATPVLLVATTGADPSRELSELAASTIGQDRYFEVAMGGGQESEALKMLHDCSQNGDWLCLKNLHLLIAWLPTLEKEISALKKPNPGFRLWLTTEPHPGFPTILLQTSVKLTFESPPGLKKNLQRTYEGWNEEMIAKSGSPKRAQLLFLLAWFHALMQERRTYMPQGWVKFYEFSLGDLRAGINVVNMVTDPEMMKNGKGDIDWEVSESQLICEFFNVIFHYFESLECFV